jgi:hypothetical protein
VPVSPPRTGPMERFEPRSLTDEDLDDLASFTGLDRAACLARVQTYSMREMAEAWRQADPYPRSDPGLLPDDGSLRLRADAVAREPRESITGWRFSTWLAGIPRSSGTSGFSSSAVASEPTLSISPLRGIT